MLNGSSHFRFFASSEKEYCVFAIHTGKFPKPNFLIFSISEVASSENSTSSAPYISFATFLIFSSIASSNSYANLKFSSSSQRATTFSAKSLAPSPPFAQASTKLIFIPCSFNLFCTNSISFSVSVKNLLIATITFKPNLFFILSMCLKRLCIPFSSVSIFSSCTSSFKLPPWYFKALIVATQTTALGFKPSCLHLISKNFSAPKSAPKPASVIQYSPSFNASFVALTLLQPCAIFANGPPWISAGVFSSVCTKLGLIASFKSTATLPSALSSDTVIGSSFSLYPYNNFSELFSLNLLYL